MWVGKNIDQRNFIFEDLCLTNSKKDQILEVTIDN